MALSVKTRVDSPRARARSPSVKSPHTSAAQRPAQRRGRTRGGAASAVPSGAQCRGRGARLALPEGPGASALRVFTWYPPEH